MPSNCREESMLSGKEMSLAVSLSSDQAVPVRDRNESLMRVAGA
jgi:hypothetical protein